MAKFLTLNTHSWMEEAPLDKLEILADAILEEDYDAICLQEINQLLDSEPTASPLNYVEVAGGPAIHDDHYALKLVQLLSQKGRDYYWSWAYNHIGFDIYQEGVAILSKQPLEARSILVSEVDDETDYHTRRALMAKTQVDGRDVVLVSLHLSWWGKGFEEEWQKLETELKKLDSPLVLMGDFNNPQGNSGYRQVLASDLRLQDSHFAAQRSYGQATIEKDIAGWEGNKEALKVDYIFASQSFTVETSQVIFDGSHYPQISDHCGLASQMEVGD